MSVDCATRLSSTVVSIVVRSGTNVKEGRWDAYTMYKSIVQ